MGAFYSTAVIVGSSPAAVYAQVQEVPAYVSPSVGQYVVVYPDLLSGGGIDLSEVWRSVSKSLQVAVLSAAVFDDDALYYELWVNGELKDRYVSDAEVMGLDTNLVGPQGGDPRVLCSVFKCSDVERLVEILTAVQTDTRYVFETERHADLAEVLGLPKASVGCSYAYIAQGECPDGLDRTQFRQTTPSQPIVPVAEATGPRTKVDSYAKVRILGDSGEGIVELKSGATKQVPLDQVEAFLLEQGVTTNTGIVVIPDRQTPYDHIGRLLTTLQRAKYPVAFKPEDK